MDPITIAALVIGGGLLLAFWNHIRALFMRFVIPTVTKILGDTIGGALASLLSYVETPITKLRASLARLWRTVTERILGIKTTYKVQGSEVIENTDVFLLPKTDGDQVEVVTQRRKLTYDMLPQSIRSRMYRQNTNTAELDGLEALRNRLEATAKKQGEPISLAAAEG